MLAALDETALPAVSRILTDLGPDFTVHAFIEVPSAADILPLDARSDIDITWLVRRDSDHGRPLVEQVRRQLGLGPLDPTWRPPDPPSDLDIDVWETPNYSSSGQNLEDDIHHRALDADLHAWIAGESWMGQDAAAVASHRIRHGPKPSRVHGLLETRDRDAKLAHLRRVTSATRTSVPQARGSKPADSALSREVQRSWHTARRGAAARIPPTHALSG